MANRGCSSHQRTVCLGGANVDVRVSRAACVPSHARSMFHADTRRVDCGGGLGRTNNVLSEISGLCRRVLEARAPEDHVIRVVVSCDDMFNLRPMELPRCSNLCGKITHMTQHVSQLAWHLPMLHPMPAACAAVM